MSDAEATTPSGTAPAAETHRGLSVYKPGQGYYTRMGTVIGVALLSLLGIQWAWEYLEAIRIGSINARYVAAGGGILIGAVITWFTYCLVFLKPASVEFLIATEGEMKKVNWSTRREIVGSTMAVIATTLIIAVFCYGIDLAFTWFFGQIKVLDIG
ncbi:MAG: preprotein translocase subunit SecE [Planctomycetota bacterium]